MTDNPYLHVRESAVRKSGSAITMLTSIIGLCGRRMQVTWWTVSQGTSVIWLVVTAVSLVGCGSGKSDPVNLRNAALSIRREMPRAELISLLGRPDSEFPFGEEIMLQYGGATDKRGMLVVFIDIDETVIKWSWSRGDEVVVSEAVWREERVRSGSARTGNEKDAD